MVHEDARAADRAERLRLTVVCAGAAAGVPWWPMAATLCRSYLAGAFPSHADHAALVAFLAAALATCAVLAVRGDACGGAQAARHFAVGGAVAGCAMYAVACVPSEVGDLLRGVGAAFAGEATACLAAVWHDKLRGATVGWTFACTTAVLGCASVLVYAGFLLEETLVVGVSALLTAGSFAAAYGTRGPELGEVGEPPVQVGRLFYATRKRLRVRLFVAGLLCAFAFTCMLYRFVAASYDRVPTYVFLAGCGGVLVFLAMVALATLMHHEINGVLAFRLSMIAAVPAFFPMEPGSYFSIVFALVFTLLALFVFAGSFSLMLADASACADVGGRRTAHIGWTGAALGALAGLAVGVASCASLNGRLSQNTIGISLLGLAAILCTFVATSVLIDCDALRDLRFLSVGKLPLSYTLYEGEQEPQEPGGRGLLACCKELALAGGLTQREGEVLVILARGSSLAKVQEELFISQGTAITHRSNIYRKLNIHSKQELLDRIDELRGGAG